MDAVADFARHGFAVIPGVADAGQCAWYAAQTGAHGSAGTRTLLSQSWCAELADSLVSSPALRALLPAGHVAVQCTFFEKSGSVNWLVPVHQDLSIPVHQRIENPSLRGWSRKEDGWHVQPHRDMLEQLVAVRLHLDPCGADDGPVYLVPGSHLQGAISPRDAVAMRQGEQACLVQAGDVLLMRPLVLHRSSKATGNSRRRVLHFLFGPAGLPHGLEWPKRGGWHYETDHHNS
ncbi:phytanoyl-CoA dioxygenase family protein [Duganella sp. Root1480D1]|uniref:phytanoyl-CoA dioxygenase family protein n=1 Tax=Duganella sp. Root1480D1 TaxID=1736471 RepID=UPI0009E73DDD|nr:phytanoyl-CoA dioxygenase family protein [Duganella sp. Root1480D1]